MSLWNYKGTELVPFADVYEMMIEPVQWEANYLQTSHLTCTSENIRRGIDLLLASEQRYCS